MKPNLKGTKVHPTIILPLKHSESLQIFENKPDPDIWRAFNNGNEMAFNYIYRVYFSGMFRYGSQITRDSEIIQDCIQNIFIDLRKRRGSLSEVLNIKAYLFKIIQRELIRKLNQAKSLPFQKFHEDHFPIEVSHETKMIHHEYEDEKRKSIQNALNQLTARQRQAILLLYEEGMSYKEVAEVMELNEVKSARKIIYRALASLKTVLKK